jgi:FkbM family methyltransferase
MSRDRLNLLRILSRHLPAGVVAELNSAQFRYPWLGRVLRVIAGVVASGETIIARGPAAGLRIDATGRNAGYALGTSDPHEQEWLSRNLSAGDVLFDVGANIGFFTLLGGRLVGAGGAVVAFEPLPQNLVQLRKNVALNEFRQIMVVGAAVSDELGRASLVVPPGRRDAAHLMRPREGGELPTIDVQVVTIDHWLGESGTRPPTVLKVDVEGAEINVLRGAQGTIEAWHPKILVEVHWLGQRFVEYVNGELEPLGYSARTIDGSALPVDVSRYHAEIVYQSHRP